MTTLHTVGFLLILFVLCWELHDLKKRILRLEIDLKHLQARVAQGW